MHVWVTKRTIISSSFTYLCGRAYTHAHTHTHTHTHTQMIKYCGSNTVTRMTFLCPSLIELVPPGASSPHRNTSARVNE